MAEATEAPRSRHGGGHTVPAKVISTHGKLTVGNGIADEEGAQQPVAPLPDWQDGFCTEDIIKRDSRSASLAAS